MAFERYRWPVSTGIPSRETPNGSFRTFRMEEDHYSKEFDDAPMPHSIFFTKVGHAIHGTDSVNRLGTPASPRLRASVARQCNDALCAGREEGVLEHDRHPDRLGAGRACPQPAQGAKRGRGRELPPSHVEQQYSPPAQPVDITPAPVIQGRRIAPQVVPKMAISIRPTAVGRRTLSGAAPPSLRCAGLSAAAVPV